ncbi:MAG: hypothetical protein GY838_13495 [bacterium]|nr:hypothetical protein [bacterium]
MTVIDSTNMTKPKRGDRVLSQRDTELGTVTMVKHGLVYWAPDDRPDLTVTTQVPWADAIQGRGYRFVRKD